MDFLPLLVDLKQGRCLVVGGGKVATRKVSVLLQAHAAITVVSPAITPALARLIAHHPRQIHWLKSYFDAGFLHAQPLVVAATDDQTVNRQISLAAKARRIPVNVADNPQASTVLLMSVLDRSPLLVAVGSSGASPVLSRQLRARLAALIPPAYAGLAALAGRFRAEAQKVFKPSLRRRFWESVMQGRVADLMLLGREQEAESLLQSMLDEPDQRALEQGEVYLIGAGPGDPELLTLKALRLMQQADVVFYDRLVSREVLELVHRDAERIYVGKQRAWHFRRQEEINQLLLEHARAGKRVLRLKGGDPFIFGRGGEEIETLADNQIRFQVVPGITAASGCASYAGIPLTHRDYAQSCVFVTGQLKAGELDLPWQSLVQPRQTVVVYMGLAGLPVLSRQLQAHGMPAATPAALIQQGTTSGQRVWVSDIEQLPALAEREQPTAPTLLIIGDVVTLHDRLSWY